MDRVSGLLRRLAAARPHWLAVADGGSGRGLDLRQLDRGATDVGAGIRRLGIGPKDVVQIRYGRDRWIDHALAYFGVVRSGATALLVPPNLTDREARLVADAVPSSLCVGEAGTDVDELAASGRSSPPAPRPPAALTASIAHMLLTSGTTATPKIVAFPHTSIVRGHDHRPRTASQVRALHTFAPASYAGTQAAFLTQLERFVCSVPLAELSVAAFDEAVERWRPRLALMTPTTAQTLVEAVTVDPSAYRCLRGIWLSGARAGEAVRQALSVALPGASIHAVYGLTEAGRLTLSMRHDPRRPDAVGRCRSGGFQLLQLDEDVPAGQAELGELAFRASSDLFPHEVGTTVRPGWTRTGDLATQDADGYLYYVGRRDEVANVAGRRTSLHEIEEVLREHPLVSDAAVVVVPSPAVGERIAAAIEVTAGTSAADVYPFLAERLSREKLPWQMLPVEALPRSENGKVRRREVVALFSGGDAWAGTSASTPARRVG
jgi:long-chain acyl-CoA synthetase